MIASGLYFVSMLTLPDALQEVFIDASRTPASALPGNRTWTGAVFREIFNTHFADADQWIADDTSTVIEHELPPLIKTIEVVGTDEEELTYMEWIFQQTGFNLPTVGCDVMSRRNSLAGFSNMSLVAGRDAAFGHFRVSHVHSVQKNWLAREPSFVAVVVGMQEQPNSSSLYTGGDEWDVDQHLRDQTTWISRLDDATTELGVIDANEATINLFEAGEVRFLSDWDPAKLSSTGTETAEGTEGSETFSSLAQMWAGASVLTDIGLF